MSVTINEETSTCIMKCLTVAYLLTHNRVVTAAKPVNHHRLIAVTVLNMICVLGHELMFTSNELSWI